VQKCAQMKDCVSAVKCLAGYDDQTASYRIPSLEVGHTLKKLSKILKRRVTENRRYDCIPNIDYLHDLCIS